MAPRRLRVAAAGTGLLVITVLVALSPSFGRAKPSSAYRPPLPPDALTNGCYPLPAGVTLDFDHQVRRDGDVTVPGEGRRRRLELQYDLIDLGPATAAVTASFTRVGFHVGAGSAGPAPAGGRSVALAKPGVGEVSAVLTPMSPLPADQIVRGTIVLDLPVAARASDAPVCSDPASTKRFGPEPAR